MEEMGTTLALALLWTSTGTFTSGVEPALPIFPPSCMAFLEEVAVMASGQRLDGTVGF